MDPLKEKFKAKADVLSAEIKDIIKNHGELKLGEITAVEKVCLSALWLTQYQVFAIIEQPFSKCGTKPMKELPGGFFILNGIVEHLTIYGINLRLQ